MVEAILSGTKNQTRRIIKPQPIFNPMYYGSWVIDTKKQTTSIRSFNEGIYADVCPLGVPGDKLWIREEHKIWVNGGGRYWNCEYKDGTAIPPIYYKDIPLDTLDRISKRKTLGQFQRARFMPRIFSRTILEIIDVRIQRLNDITKEDATREGIKHGQCGVLGFRYKDYSIDPSGYGHPDHDFPSTNDPIYSFRTLWESINGLDSWEQNPWVWVITFKTLQPQSATN